MTEYQTKPKKAHEKENLVSKASPPRKSKKDDNAHSEGLDLLARLVLGGEILEDLNLHMNYTVQPIAFIPTLRSQGTAEEILDRLPYSQPKKQLPVYYLILKWSSKAGGCVAKNGKLRCALRKQGIYISDDALQTALATLERAKLIVRYMKPLGRKKGCRRLIVPIGMAHRAIALLHSLNAKDAAAYLLTRFAPFAHEHTKKQIDKLAIIKRMEEEKIRRRRSKKPRPYLSPLGIEIKENTYSDAKRRSRLRREAVAIEGFLLTQRQDYFFYLSKLEDPRTLKALGILGIASEKHIEFFRYVIEETHYDTLGGVTRSLVLWLEKIWNRTGGDYSKIFEAGDHKRRYPEQVKPGVPDSILEVCSAAGRLSSRCHCLDIRREENFLVFRRHDLERRRPKDDHHWFSEARIEKRIDLKDLSYGRLIRETRAYIQSAKIEKMTSLWDQEIQRYSVA